VCAQKSPALARRVLLQFRQVGLILDLFREKPNGRRMSLGVRCAQHPPTRADHRRPGAGRGPVKYVARSPVGWADPGLVPGEAQRASNVVGVRCAQHQPARIVGLRCAQHQPTRADHRRPGAGRGPVKYVARSPVGWADPGLVPREAQRASNVVGLRCAQHQPTRANHRRPGAGRGPVKYVARSRVGWADPGLVPGEAQRASNVVGLRCAQHQPTRADHRRPGAGRGPVKYVARSPVGWADPGLVPGEAQRASNVVGLRCAQHQHQPTRADHRRPGAGRGPVKYVARSRVGWADPGLVPGEAQRASNVVGLRCAQHQPTRAFRHEKARRLCAGPFFATTGQCWWSLSPWRCLSPWCLLPLSCLSQPLCRPLSWWPR